MSERHTISPKNKTHTYYLLFFPQGHAIHTLGILLGVFLKVETVGAMLMPLCKLEK